MDIPVYARKWPVVSKRHLATQLNQLVLPTRAISRAWNSRIETVQDVLDRTPDEMARFLGPATYLSLWEALLYLDNPKPTKAAKVDVAACPQGHITLVKRPHPTRGTTDHWVGRVPIQQAVADYITEMLTRHQLLPSAGLQAQLAQQVFCNVANNQKVTLKCAFGEATIEFKWDHEGRLITVGMILRRPHFYRNCPLARFCYGNEQQFIKEHVAGIPEWLEGLRRNVRTMLRVRVTESGVNITFDRKRAWKSSMFEDLRKAGIPSKEAFAAIERAIR